MTKVETVKNWIRDLDPGLKWIKFEEHSGRLTQIFRQVCRDHQD